MPSIWYVYLLYNYLGCRNGLMPTIREKRIGGELRDFEDFYCKDYKCDRNDDYMISVAVPGMAGWREFFVDICVVI